MVRGVEDSFEMIQVLYIYYVLYFYHYGDSSTSDQQASDPRGWGPLGYRLTILCYKLEICLKSKS